MKKGLMLIVSVALISGYGILFADEQQQTQPQQQPKQENKKAMTMEEFVDEFNKGLSVNEKLFDRFFSESYFNTNPEPFKQIENIRNMMKEEIKNYDLNYFENVFNNWYKDRFESADFGITTQEKGSKVIMKINVPGLDANNVVIDINDKRIKINGSFNKVNEIRDSKNNVISKSQEYRSFSKLMSLPGGAVSDKAQIKVEKDTIIITFNKK